MIEIIIFIRYIYIYILRNRRDSNGCETVERRYIRSASEVKENRMGGPILFLSFFSCNDRRVDQLSENRPNIITVKIYMNTHKRLYKFKSLIFPHKIPFARQCVQLKRKYFFFNSLCFTGYLNLTFTD